MHSRSRGAADAVDAVAAGCAYLPGGSTDWVGGACEDERQVAVAARTEDGGSRAERETQGVLSLCASLNAWEASPALDGSALPGFAELRDASKAVVLASLQHNRTLTSLSLRGCALGQAAAMALGQLCSSVASLIAMDLRDNAIGEAGLGALAAALDQRSALRELRLEHALPGPLSAAAVDALALALGRCRSVQHLWLGSVQPAATALGGSAARLQRAILLNHEAASGGAAAPARAVRDDLRAGPLSPPPSPPSARPSPPPSPPSPPSAAARFPAAAPLSPAKDPETDAISAVVDALRGGRLRTLRLTHDATAARAPLRAQLRLLGAMCDCRSLRVAQLVNVGLGDAWAAALARALPRMDTIRVLDISHNLIGAEGGRALVAALPLNHSLVWLQLLPQWLSLPAGVEAECQRALSRRRVKCEVHVRGARGVHSARGDAGEPIVQFEWEGRRHTTSSAPAGINARWSERFSLLVPSSLLWPPSRLPLPLTVLDARRRAQRSADPPMGVCEMPLSSLLLADTLSVACTLVRDPTAAPIDAPPGELIVELSTLHVGHSHPDDLSPGVPLARRHALVEQRRADHRAATVLQARWRGRTAAKRSGRASVASVVQRAAELHAGGALCLALHRCCRFNPLLRCLRVVGPATAAPLLGDTKRSDAHAILAEQWRRRRILLRAMLCLLGLLCTTCLGAAGVLLLILDSSESQP